MANITVTAAAERAVPIHRTIATGPGGTLLVLKPGDELEVDDTMTAVQRSLGNGDLVRVDKPRARDAGERFLAAAAARTAGEAA